MKTETVQIQTNGNTNYRNAVNLKTGELIPVDSHNGSGLNNH